MGSFLETLAAIIESIDKLVWGLPLPIVVMGTGIFLTFLLKFLSIRKFGFILSNTLFKMFKKGEGEGEVTPFQAVSTALAATVGTGNIIGVATALSLGGPGAVFWMWVAALFGMMTKYSEVTLSVAYRSFNEKGEVQGGPMQYIAKGLKRPKLAAVFAFFGAFAAFGIGDAVQANAITNNLFENFGFNPYIIAAVTMVLLALVIIGGIKRIGAIAEILIPFMSVFYIIGGIVVLVTFRANILPMLKLIVVEAFTLKAVSGGTVGYTLFTAMRYGVARGVFTNEAGLGSSPIAHAAATVDHPARQGIWGVFEVFMDTIVICTFSALCILTSGVFGPNGDPSTMASDAFELAFTGGRYIVAIGIVLFAFSTIVGWSYYGEICAKYLFGDKIALPYKIVFIIVGFIGAVTNLTTVWAIADILNGLMAVPNLIAVVALSGVVFKLTKDFFVDHDPNVIRTDKDWEKLLK